MDRKFLYVQSLSMCSLVNYDYNMKGMGGSLHECVISSCDTSWYIFLKCTVRKSVPPRNPGLTNMYFVLVIGHLAHAVEKDICIM
jgi:hypothetical protein